MPHPKERFQFVTFGEAEPQQPAVLPGYPVSEQPEPSVAKASIGAVNPDFA